MHAKTSSGCQDVYFSSPYIIENWEDAKFELDGQKVYRHGVTLSVQVINEYFNKSGTTTSDFKYIIPHQANIRMLREMAQQLEVPLEKFLINIDKVGNTAGASIPLCLSQKVDEGRISKGDRLLLVSFGAGYALEVIDLYF
jgi:3-oxoacyl-[acyl-carrier-protein] synthase-3